MTDWPGESHQEVVWAAPKEPVTRIVSWYEPSNAVGGGAGGGLLWIVPIGPAHPAITSIGTMAWSGRTTIRLLPLDAGAQAQVPDWLPSIRSDGKINRAFVIERGRPRDHFPP